MEATVFNPAQLKLINLVSVLNTPEELNGLQKVISDYLAKQLEGEINNLWEDGTLTDEKVENFRQLHERTPYTKKHI
ncbi:MAG: dephospho-CoA kinase [Bacteroidaceae bacterium]|nr:dephospho-CoA kinase [Bacteroidaceae bacterium]